MNINSVSDNIRMSAAFLAYLADIEGNNRCETIAAYYEGPVNLSNTASSPRPRPMWPAWRRSSPASSRGAGDGSSRAVVAWLGSASWRGRRPTAREGPGDFFPGC